MAPFGAALIFIIALRAVHHALADVSYGTLWRAIVSLGPAQLAGAVGLTAIAYLALTGYDALALRYVRHPLSYSRTGFASFISFAFSNSVGLAMLTGASVRGRLYSAWGLTTPVIGRIIAFTAATLWLGIFAVAGSALVIEPGTLSPLLHLPPAATRLVGLVGLGMVTAYFAWCLRWRRPLAVFGWHFEPPAPPLALGQLAASSLDWLAAAGVLYLLLPAGAGLSYFGLAGIFVVAQALGLASHVPGGLGVFEGTVLFLARGAVPAEALAGALLAFRAIYYFVPLLGATALLAGHEGLRQRERLGTLSRTAARVVQVFIAPLLSMAVFATGTILLLSGATPTIGWRLKLLSDFVPLPVLEASHFAASMVGMALLLLAYGLYRRLSAAWMLTVVLLATAIVTSLFKGLDFEEAAVATLALGCLVPARGRFHRQSSLLAEMWSPGWILSIAVALGASIWLGFFAYRHVEYSHQLWWQFEFGADAPRFLRATVGAAAVALALAFARLLRPAHHLSATPDSADLEHARAAIAGWPQASANLALLGDKQILFSDSGRGFLMYAVQGRSWVVMGDPVGDEAEATELAWRFRELCDQHGGWPVFYEVSRDRLALFLEQGLTLLKLGENARVPLPGFTLEGKDRASLRRWRNASEKAGCTVELLPAGGSDAHLADLTRISDDWLAAKHTREKRFSLGRFEPAYIRQFPLALVRLQGRIVAFATLWTTGTRDELTVDLMRYASDAPPNVMTYLFVQVMLWGKAEGYQWFDLGMAPLSGMGNRTLAPLWHRLGAFVFHHGENFYHFKGLREYKARFDPVWEPRYLASPGGLALPFILTDIAALISGGLKGVFAK
jgi:phosphatidylglycerol lysyltransferase